MARMMSCGSIPAAWLTWLAWITISVASVQGADVQTLCYAHQLTRDMFPNCKALSSTFAVHWSIAGDSILLGIAANWTGNWLAFGLSEAGGMKGADMFVIRRQNTNGDWSVIDYHSTDFVTPNEDVQQDLTLLGNVTVMNSITTALIRRKLATCDIADDIEILQGITNSVIWAYGNGWGYHGPDNRGNSKVLFWPRPEDDVIISASSTGGLEPTSSLQVHMVKMDNVEVPADVTAYKCTHFLLPNDTKYHIVQYTPIVDSSLVHHMILYACSGSPQTLQTFYDCGDMDEYCQQIFLTWAPGGGTVDLPRAAGFGVGATSVQWVSLQVHFNNPKQLTSATATAGFNLSLTTQLRPHDMGVLSVGEMNLIIPPRDSNFQTPPNICPGECTKRYSGNLTLVYMHMHMHQIGKRMSTRLIRDGVELAPVGVLDAYDFNFQGMLEVPRTTTLVPGDTLLTTCTFDSSYRNDTTYFGLSSEDEMCYNFIFYYPLQPNADQCVTLAYGGSEYGSLASCMEIPPEFAAIAQDNITMYVDQGYLVYGSAPNITKPYDALAECLSRQVGSPPALPQPPTTSPAPFPASPRGPPPALVPPPPNGSSSRVPLGMSLLSVCFVAVLAIISAVTL